jgi:tRNA 2-(methylsulfanyl)-N6-isopentenyladenosine37 hydroxylase
MSGPADPAPSDATTTHAGVLAELPLLAPTPGGWAELAAAHLDVFLADHAVCEQQAAQFALSLVGQYPEDDELVDRMSALAAEEAVHLRRVAALLRRRGAHAGGRRANPWVQELRGHMESGHGPALKVDRLLLGALIEARSCERFTLLMEATDDPEVRRLLADLGPAEARHWRLFHHLASREMPAGELARRWQRWLEIEAGATARRGTSPTVHG